MDIYFLNKDTLTYDDETHTYYLNGERVMSITEAMKLVNDKYKLISNKVLANAQMRGNRVHFEISAFEEYNYKDLEATEEFRNYLVLKRAFNWEYLGGERPVVVRYKGFTLAGRFDLLLRLNGEKLIADVKTTSAYDKKYVALQTELYALGYNQTYPKEEPVTNTAGIHLNQNKYKFDRFLPKVDVDWFFVQLGKALEEKRGEEQCSQQ